MHGICVHLWINLCEFDSKPSYGFLSLRANPLGLSKLPYSRRQFCGFVWICELSAVQSVWSAVLQSVVFQGRIDAKGHVAMELLFRDYYCNQESETVSSWRHETVQRVHRRGKQRRYIRLDLRANNAATQSADVFSHRTHDAIAKSSGGHGRRLADGFYSRCPRTNRRGQ